MDFGVLNETGVKKGIGTSDIEKETLALAGDNIFKAAEFAKNIFTADENFAKTPCSTDEFTGKRLDFES